MPSKIRDKRKAIMFQSNSTRYSWCQFDYGRPKKPISMTTSDFYFLLNIYLVDEMLTCHLA